MSDALVKSLQIQVEILAKYNDILSDALTRVRTYLESGAYHGMISGKDGREHTIAVIDNALKQGE